MLALREQEIGGVKPQALAFGVSDHGSSSIA
jgi:hypothetical protein